MIPRRTAREHSSCQVCLLITITKSVCAVLYSPVTYCGCVGLHECPHVTCAGTQSRGIGCYYSSVPVPTFSLDVIVTKSAPYTLALYIIDWDMQSRQQVMPLQRRTLTHVIYHMGQVVMLMDFETKNLIAPTQHVADYAGGVYLVYTFDTSVRIRASSVRGPNAVISAIFLD